MAETFEDLTALGALGVLSEAEMRELDALRTRSAEEESLTLAYAEAAALIGTSLEPIEPPAAARAAVIFAIREPEVVRASGAEWLEIFAGVAVRKLRSDRDRRTVTSLLRIAPGGVYPGHRHKGAEDSYVVSGSCRFGAISLEQGDFIRIEPGGGHGDVTSESGCLLLVVSDWADVAA